MEKAANEEDAVNRAKTTSQLLEQVSERMTFPPPEERRRIRMEAQVSLRELADALGVSPMAVMRWEKGALPRSHQTVHEYRELLAALEALTAESP